MGIANTGWRKSALAWTTPAWVLLPHFIGIWVCEEGGSGTGRCAGVVYVWTAAGRWYPVSAGVDLVDYSMGGGSTAGIFSDGFLSLLLCIEDALCIYKSGGLPLHFWLGRAPAASNPDGRYLVAKVCGMAGWTR